MSYTHAYTPLITINSPKAELRRYVEEIHFFDHRPEFIQLLRSQIQVMCVFGLLLARVYLYEYDLTPFWVNVKLKGAASLRRPQKIVSRKRSLNLHILDCR